MFFLLSVSQCRANTIDVGSFYSLMNTALQDGDVFNITDDLDSDESIGQHFYNYDINFDGNNYSIDGNMTYGGFILSKNNDFSDSICINELSNINDLLVFLENNNYLNSCSCCFGSIGQKINHQQIKKDEWIKMLPTTIESGIDEEYARTLVKKLDFKSDCMKRKNIN